MKNGYDQFFKNAQRAARGEPAATPTSRLKKPTPKRRRRKPFPLGLALFSALGIAAAGWGTLNSDQVEKLTKNIEISFIAAASADEAKPASSKPTEAKKDAAKIKTPASGAPAAETSVDTSSSPDHLAKLSEREKALNVREEEIARQEAELAQMKQDLEKRLADLETMRAKISEVLADRVKVDDQKVDTLVQMYSNMKPPQAAKIFETLDEDLAVEILSRMKKKSAADLMNLLPAAKAQVFSEKYAGYKRAPASK